MLVKIYELIHSFFFLKNHKKKNDNNLKATPNTNKIPIAYHLLKSNFNWSIKDSLKATSFSSNPMKLYLFGDKYSIQPIHFGKSALFLKNPEKVIIGSKNIGMIAATSFSSKITLPTKSPKDAPQNDINAKFKQCKKNCPPVFERPTIK